MDERTLPRPAAELSTGLDMGNLKPLDVAFNSIINRLPDLCMRPVSRWSGEDNFFNKTKTIKLEPFKRQSYFDRCISPTLLTGRREQPPAAASGDCRSLRGESKSQAQIRSTNQQFKNSLSRLSDGTSPNGSRCTANNEKRTKKKGDEQGLKLFDQGDKKRALEERNKIRKKYSRIGIRRPVAAAANSAPGGGGRRDKPPGYDRLFSGVLSEGYPYANPIPECMLTEQNIDNLREIIVSSTDIEWRMLTPIRPESDYEERFFDKLIHLHRSRYQTRLELGYFDSDHRRVPFKHTRHPYMIQYPTKLAKNVHHQQQASERLPLLSGARKLVVNRGAAAAAANRLSTSGFCAVTNAKLRKHTGRRKSSILEPPANKDAGQQLMIPALTLTTEFESNEPIEQLPDADLAAPANDDSKLVAGSSQQPQQQQPAADDNRGEFSYELFSRFSRKNQETKQQKTTAQGRHEHQSRKHQPLVLADRSQSEESLLEAQLDEIVGHLMSNTASIID